MKNIWLVVTSNLSRLIRDKAMLIALTVVLPIIVCLGVYFSKPFDLKGKIAVVGANVEQEEQIKKSIKGNGKISLEFLDESVSKTDLIKGLYISEINLESGEPMVIAYGKEEVRKEIEAGLKGEVYEGKKVTTTVEAKIVGFLLMFLFMGATSIMDHFLSDRDNKVYTRVLNSNLQYHEYIFGQILYAMLVITVPAMVMTLGVIGVLGVELSMSIISFALVIILFGFLCTSFATIICVIFKQKMAAQMNSSAIGIITCMLGGCLINFEDTNKVVGFLRDLIPQKRLLDLVNEFNNPDLFYVIGSIVVLISLSIIIGKRQYENGEFI